MPRRANHVVVTSVGLTVLVSTVVGLLGWRLLSQEETLVHQQARDRLERTVDEMVVKFAGRLSEIESWLAQKSGLSTGVSPLATGAILVWFSDTRIDVAPFGGLLYYPQVPLPPPVDPSVFAQADQLEFETLRLAAAASVLEPLTKSDNLTIRAEAMLRLARILGKQRRLTDAISVYDSLNRIAGAEDPPIGNLTMSRGIGQLLLRSDPSQNVYFEIPSSRAFQPDRAMAMAVAGVAALMRRETLRDRAGVPYGLLSQFARCQLLAMSGRGNEAREDARRLVSEMSTGRWRLAKASFAFYDSAARTLAGLPPPPPPRVAVAEQVESIWNEWQSFRRSGSPSLPRRAYRSGSTPVIAVLSANREQLAALVVEGNSFRSIGLDLDSAGVNVRASLVDEQDRLILGNTLEPAGVEAVRSLSALSLPWRLRLTASNEEAGALLRARRNYVIMALSVFVLLVASACYAIARGVRREAVAGQLQGDFVSAVSHEFRSPLTALRQLTELLAHGRVQDVSRQRMYFDVLLRETSRLHHLVENLLDFGRLDAGRQDYRFEPIQLSALVRDSIHDYQADAEVNDHRIEYTTDSDSLTVNADREALKRVVRNLVENAVKYSPGAQTVWVETAADGEAAVVRVRDEGIGVSHEEQSRIFEKFVRGEAAKNACINGTGIGLSMVKEIVRMHQGTVSVQSEVGRGSTFTVRLPLTGGVGRGRP